jgi:hypothetical protein
MNLLLTNRRLWCSIKRKNQTEMQTSTTVAQPMNAQISYGAQQMDACGMKGQADNLNRVAEAESTATDVMIASSSKFLAREVVWSVNGSSSANVSEQEVERSYCEKIRGFFTFIRSYTALTGTELVYAVWLVLRLSHIDR